MLLTLHRGEERAIVRAGDPSEEDLRAIGFSESGEDVKPPPAEEPESESEDAAVEGAPVYVSEDGDLANSPGEGFEPLPDAPKAWIAEAIRALGGEADGRSAHDKLAADLAELTEASDG